MSSQDGLQDLVEEMLRGGSSTSTSLMRFEFMRVASFHNFPDGLLVSALRLARAGTYYTGYGRECRCYFCGFSQSDWSCGINRSHFDHSFDGSTTSTNVPIPRVYVEEITGEPQSVTPEVSEYRPLPIQRNDESAISNAGLSRSILQNNNSRYTDRLNTFTNWPSQISQRPYELAAAGFFYSGRGDRVQCSFCGGQLHQWERSDVPFHEHLRWFPDCPFVKQCFQQPFSIVPTSVPSGVDLRVIRKVLQYGYDQTDIKKAICELSSRMVTEEITALEILKFLYQGGPRN
ncbi:E3 ubiquitin-protein ligase XIAP-like [Saccostrea echinata]|uniref:E3 ubiquitin-protein ligase XIAP-like n=1 Tax=Saccostrea echinata TaxID=191078 RepID=UPI002A824FB4|nr:E3 ubiquitin-protein ligase XIAP-like [Saccostrea echinata]